MANPGTDPRGFLDACPDLERFAGDPAVSAALARGDARALHAALVQRRRRGRGPGEERALAAILARRRLFVAPVTSAPGLFTFNGIGARMVGRSDAAPDGTHVGTHFLTFLYLPVWPLAQYLVASEGDRYRFFGEVPLSGALKAWRAAVGALALVAVLWGGVAAWQEGATATVHLVNGLDVPVVVEVGGRRHDVAARQGHRAVALATGRQHVRATTEEGRVVEELDVEVPARTALVAYSVLGAAPLVVEEVFYGKADSPRRKALRVTVHAGRSLVTANRVDYVFQEPPAQLRAPEQGAVRARAWTPEGGWRAAVALLRNDGRAQDAERLALALVQAPLRSEDAFTTATELAYARQGMEGALSVAEAAVGADPGWVDAHRARQGALAALGRGDEARRVYRDLEARNPESPLHAYLRARAEKGAEGNRLVEAGLRRFPDDANLLRAASWHRSRSGRLAEAIATWERLERVDGEAAADLLPLRAVALARVGRAGDAAALVAARQDLKPDLPGALLYARLARLVPAPAHPPRHYLEALRRGLSPGEAAFLRLAAAVSLGDPPPAAADLAAIEDAAALAGASLVRAALVDPAAAARQLSKAGRAEAAFVAPVLRLALGAEVARSEPALVAPIVAEIDGVPGLAALVGRFVVRGEDSPELDELAEEHRTALLLGRARALEAAGADARAVYAEIRRREAVPGPVSVLLARWPKAKAGAGRGPGPPARPGPRRPR